MVIMLVIAAAAAITGCVAPPEQTTIVSLEFDDGTSDQALGAAELRAHGMRGTFFVNSGLLGKRGYFTLPQVRDLQQDGHEIGGHSLQHLHLPTLGHQALIHQICDDRTALLEAGLTVDSFAYPFGQKSATAEQVVASCGYRSARVVGGISASRFSIGGTHEESLLPPDPYATRTPRSIRRDTTLDEMKRDVRAAERAGGTGWVQIVMHHVCDNCNLYSVRESTLHEFLDWLAIERERGRVEIRTVGDVMDIVDADGAAPRQGVVSP